MDRQALSVEQVFAYRLRDARLSKQWNQQQLADAMERIGAPINRATISKIEAAARGVGGEHGTRPPHGSQRSVSLAEAIAFAVALDIPPASLFLPIIRDDDVQLAPGVQVDVDTAHAWARGEQPLDPDDERFYRFQAVPNRQVATAEWLEEHGVRVVQEDRIAGPITRLRPGDRPGRKDDDR